MDLGTREWCARVRRALVPELDAISAGWRVAGEEVWGPRSLAVRVDAIHEVEPGHGRFAEHSRGDPTLGLAGWHAEVRIDGLRDERCSRALLELPWPRAAKGSIARHFVLFVHPTHP